MEISGIKAKIIQVGKNFLLNFSPSISDIFDNILNLKIGIYLIRGLGNEIIDYHNLVKMDDFIDELNQNIHTIKKVNKLTNQGEKILRELKIEVREFYSQDLSSSVNQIVKNYTNFFNRIFQDMENVLKGLQKNIVFHEKLIQSSVYIKKSDFNKNQLITLQRKLENNISNTFAILKKGNKILRDLRIQMENI